MFKEYGACADMIAPDVDEAVPAGAKPHNAAMFLALKKALCAEKMAIAKGYESGAIIVAADTIVVCGGRIIGKPAARKEAFEILKELCGKAHTVVTGVAVIAAGTEKRMAFYEESTVFFKNYTDEEINEYADTPEPYDKAGGYAVQGAWGKYIDRVEGDTNNVIGFPMDLFLKKLQAF